MTAETLAISTLVILLAFIFLGSYVAVALGMTGLILVFVFSNNPTAAINTIGSIVFSNSTNFVLVSIPLFVIMGELMSYSGLSEQMYNSLSVWFGRLPGGLLHSNILSCAIFSAISGSSVATAATIGVVALPQLEKRGYDKKVAMGSLAAGGTLGILIPPSINMIVFAMLTNQSAGQLFMAGVIPGIALTIAYMIVTFIWKLVRPKISPVERAATWDQRIKALWGILPTAFIILLVLGVIYLGIATPTEAAAYGLVAVIMVSLVFKRLHWANFKSSILVGVQTTSWIMFILIGAWAFNFSLGLLGITGALTRVIISWSLTPMMLVLVTAIFYLVMGCFVETMSLVIVTIPLIAPLFSAAGFDLIWLGVLLVMLCEAGMITPPVGLILFVIQGLKGKGTSVFEVAWGVTPYLFALFVMIALVIAFPQLSLWLPSVMMKR